MGGPKAWYPQRCRIPRDTAEGHPQTKKEKMPHSKTYACSCTHCVMCASFNTCRALRTWQFCVLLCVSWAMLIQARVCSADGLYVIFTCDLFVTNKGCKAMMGMCRVKG